MEVDSQPHHVRGHHLSTLKEGSDDDGYDDDNDDDDDGRSVKIEIPLSSLLSYRPGRGDKYYN